MSFIGNSQPKKMCKAPIFTILTNFVNLARFQIQAVNKVNWKLK